MTNNTEGRDGQTEQVYWHIWPILRGGGTSPLQRHLFLPGDAGQGGAIPRSLGEYSNLRHALCWENRVTCTLLGLYQNSSVLYAFVFV